MAKIFKPRRALRSSVKSGSKRTLVLASGELMLVGKSAIGENSKADLYLGDGVSQIQNLSPAMYGDTSEEDITITDDTSTTATAALGNVTSGATLGSILGSLKKAISLNASAIATLNDDFVVEYKESEATDGGKAFKAYDGRVSFATNSIYYTYGRVIKINARFHIAKSAGLSARAQLFKVIDRDKNQTISVNGKFFLVYGNGGGTAQVFKFTSSNYTDGFYFGGDETTNIPSSYQSNNTDAYLLHLDTISFYSRSNI